MTVLSDQKLFTHWERSHDEEEGIDILDAPHGYPFRVEVACGQFYALKDRKTGLYLIDEMSDEDTFAEAVKTHLLHANDPIAAARSQVAEALAQFMDDSTNIIDTVQEGRNGELLLTIGDDTYQLLIKPHQM